MNCRFLKSQFIRQLRPIPFECVCECLCKRATNMSADAELSSILNRRQQINDALDNGDTVKRQFRHGNIYTEFHEFTRKQIKEYQDTFNRYVRLHSIFSLLFSGLCLMLCGKMRQNQQTSSCPETKFNCCYEWVVLWVLDQ